MSIPLTGSGSLGQRCGVLMGGVLDVLAIEGGTATARVLSGASWVTRVATILADYAAGNAAQSTVDGIYNTLSSWQSSQSGLSSAVQQLLQKTVVQMAAQDQPQPDTSLTTALKFLIAQMQAAGTTFNATVSSAGALTSVGTPIGNPVLVTSLYNPSGQTLQYLFPETLSLQCTADSITGGLVAGRESVSIKGQASASSPFAYNWPLGSGSSQSLTAVDGSQNNAGGNGNLLVNSDFVTFTTTNYPDNWVIATGVAGTNVFNGTSSNAYTTGGGSLKITGDGGGTLTAVHQQVNTTSSTGAGTGGTPATVAASTPYHVNLWLKMSATPTAGVLQVALVDGSGNVINDQAGTANSFTVDLTAVSTSFVNAKGAFRLPAAPPTTVRLRLKTTTAIDDTKSLYIGRVSFCNPVQLYQGGPFCSLHSGSTKMLAGDSWTQAISVTYGIFQREFERYFSMRANGLSLPSATSSPTVADSLVV